LKSFQKVRQPLEAELFQRPALENALLDGDHPAHVLPTGHEVVVGGQRPLVGIPHSVSKSRQQFWIRATLVEYLSTVIQKGKFLTLCLSLCWCSQ